MAIAAPPLLLLFLLLAAAATASARPCKTLFYFSAATTTTAAYYPRNPNPDSLLQRPRLLTLIFTVRTTRFPKPLSSINFNSISSNNEPQSTMTSSAFPVNLFSSASKFIGDHSKEIMSLFGALLLGIGCGVLTGGTMYFLWALFSPSRFDFDDKNDGEGVHGAKKFGYVAIPANPKVIDDVDDDIKKPAPPAKVAV